VRIVVIYKHIVGSSLIWCVSL